MRLLLFSAVNMRPEPGSGSGPQSVNDRVAILPSVLHMDIC